MGQSFPWFLDSALCTGVILHGICNTKPEFNYFLFSFPGIRSREVRLDFVYLVAGYYSYLCGLALAPDRVFYIMAAIGIVSFALRIVHRRNMEKGEVYGLSRKHSHRHWESFLPRQIYRAARSFFGNLAAQSSGPSQSYMLIVVICPYWVRSCLEHSGNHSFAIRIITCKWRFFRCKKSNKIVSVRL